MPFEDLKVGGGGGASLSDSAPSPSGTASAGVSAEASRADHVHDLSNPQKLLEAIVTLNKDGSGGFTGAILGNAAPGQLAHSSGVTAIAAPGAGKRITIDSWEYEYTFATAAYGGGGNVSLRYSSVAVDISAAIGATGWTASNNTSGVMGRASAAQNTLAAAIGVNDSVIIRSSAVFTDVGGTAAGTIAIKIRYRIHTVA